MVCAIEKMCVCALREQPTPVDDYSRFLTKLKYVNASWGAAYGGVTLLVFPTEYDSSKNCMLALYITENTRVKGFVCRDAAPLPSLPRSATPLRHVTAQRHHRVTGRVRERDKNYLSRFAQFSAACLHFSGPYCPPGRVSRAMNYC